MGPQALGIHRYGMYMVYVYIIYIYIYVYGVYIYIATIDLGKLQGPHCSASLESLGFCREIIPFYGSKIQVSELL